MTALTSISIRSFQSLHSIDLSLAPFTVIVGPSSSGKSAFVRALQTLVRNQRGTAFITQGKPGCSITATLPAAIVTLTRSKSSSAADAYVTPTGRYTKLGGSTPPEVTQILGQIADPAAIASQFDPPYLLTQSPAEAARTLASLTNASILLDASREANRRRLEASSTLRTRATDHAATRDSLAAYPNHQSHQRALDATEPALARARALSARLAALQSLIDSIDFQASTVRHLRESLATAPEIPAQALVTAAQKVSYRLDALRNLLDQIAALASSIRTQRTTIATLDGTLAALDADRAALIARLGTCPQCGSPTVDGHSIHA